MNMSTPAVAGPARKLTQEELDRARLLLDQTQAVAIGATKGLSEAQWTFTPASDRWSIAENLEHMVTVLERVLGPIMDQIADAPAPPPEFDSQAVDSIIVGRIPSRLARFSAPEPMHPTGRVAPAELLDRLNANYARLRARLESGEGLRGRVIESAPLKAVSNGAFTLMDGYQWILAVAGHTERHAKQMLEVKASPGYPS
jgi:hypothetical protein